MNNLNSLNRDAKKRKEEHKPRPIDKCMYMGCPMNVTSTDSNGARCSFHHNGDYHQDVTESIKQNMSFITAYGKMVKWSSLEWHEQKNWLLQNINIPMAERELPTLYLKRYYKWLSEKIKADSVSIINKRLGLG